MNVTALCFVLSMRDWGPGATIEEPMALAPETPVLADLHSVHPKLTVGQWRPVSWDVLCVPNC